MATTKLALFNEALTVHLHERKLASLTEAREPQRVLSDIWDRGAVKHCLEQAHWKFAQRTAMLVASPDITPTFGYPNAFEKPTDCVKLSKMCSDEFFNTPLTAYVEEAGLWYSNVDPLYISYVSDDALFGGDMSLWPESFIRYVASYLAYGAAGRISGSTTNRDDVEKVMGKMLLKAASNDAMQGPTVFPPSGTWVSARLGGQTRDRGSRSRLIG